MNVDAYGDVLSASQNVIFSYAFYANVLVTGFGSHVWTILKTDDL
jgi:hypothetical protein